jgi:hypothetical protein
MKKLIKSALAIALLTVSSMSFAGETYESALAKCKIIFPGEYEAETDKGEEKTTITVTGTQGGMIYMLIATIYDEPIAEDENDLTEVATLINFANNVDSKVKGKKNLFSFDVAGDTGYYAYLKPKLNGKKYQGNYYAYCKSNIMYQFTALGMKKGYDERAANRFADSFGVE